MCALGGAIAAVPVGVGTASMVLDQMPAGVLLIAALTALLSAVVVAASLRTRWFLVCAFAPLGGALVAMLSLFVVFAFVRAGSTSTEPLSAASVGWGIGAAILFGAYAAAVGGVAGMLFAVGLVVPVAIGARYLKRPSLDGGARAGLACAVWLAAVSGFGLAYTQPVDTWAVGTALAALGLAAAFVVGGASLVHMVVVHRFLGRVRRGEERGYRIRAIEASDDVRRVLVFASAPTTWRDVAVLETMALDPVTYRLPEPVFRPVALVALW